MIQGINHKCRPHARSTNPIPVLFHLQGEVGLDVDLSAALTLHKQEE